MSYIHMNDVPPSAAFNCSGFVASVQGQIDTAKSKITAIAAALAKNDQHIASLQKTLATGGSAVAEINATQARLSAAHNAWQETQNQISALSSTIAWQNSQFGNASWLQPFIAEEQKQVANLQAKLAKESQKVQEIKKELATKETLLRTKVQPAEWDKLHKIRAHRSQLNKHMQAWRRYVNHLSTILADCGVKS
jgi:chromosome segregation ATPase